MATIRERLALIAKDASEIAVTKSSSIISIHGIHWLVALRNEVEETIDQIERELEREK